MSTPTEEITRIANDTREAFTVALTAWSETAQRYTANFDAKNPLPATADIESAIDTAYELASTLLSKQHALATTAVSAGQKAAEEMTERSRSLPLFPAPAAA
jgi:electron transfer flavoprotein alpha/beta subunit